MPSKKVWLWVSIATVITGGGLWMYFSFRNNSPNSKKNNSPGNGPVKAPSPSTLKSTDSAFPLQIGSSGANVLALQKNLNMLGAGLVEDGKFGQLTYSAVISKAGFGNYPVTQAIFDSIVNQVQQQKNIGLLTGLGK